MEQQRYNDWTRLDVFSSKGDEIIHKGDYLVCVHADDNWADDNFLPDGKWSYSVMLPLSGKAIYIPDENGKPLFWDNKDDVKQIINNWDSIILASLAAMDTPPATEGGE